MTSENGLAGPADCSRACTGARQYPALTDAGGSDAASFSAIRIQGGGALTSRVTGSRPFPWRKASGETGERGCHSDSEMAACHVTINLVHVWQCVKQIGPGVDHL